MSATSYNHNEKLFPLSLTWSVWGTTAFAASGFPIDSAGPVSCKQEMLARSILVQDALEVLESSLVLNAFRV